MGKNYTPVKKTAKVAPTWTNFHRSFANQLSRPCRTLPKFMKSTRRTTCHLVKMTRCAELIKVCEHLWRKHQRVIFTYFFNLLSQRILASQKTIFLNFVMLWCARFDHRDVLVSAFEVKVAIERGSKASNICRQFRGSGKISCFVKIAHVSPPTRLKLSLRLPGIRSTHGVTWTLQRRTSH